MLLLQCISIEAYLEKGTVSVALSIEVVYSDYLPIVGHREHSQRSKLTPLL